MGGFKSSHFDFSGVNFDTMKLIYCAKTSKSLVPKCFLGIEKARWFRIKTIVLMWCGHGDSNPNAKAREPKSRMSANSIMPACDLFYHIRLAGVNHGIAGCLAVFSSFFVISAGLFACFS